jgi:peptide/nickel transport system substrate-binding protein
MTKKIIYIAIAIILIILIYTQFVARNKAIHEVRNSSTQSKYGGNLIVGIKSDLDTFNPLFSEAALGKELVHLVMLGLADLDDKSEFKPEIAESWERSPDFLTVTYHLRKDAVWVDGVPISAYDVKFTYDLLFDPAVASPNSWVTENIKQVTAVDSHTVVFTFNQAYPDQIYDTASEFLPKHIFEKVDHKSIRSHDFGQNPLATGPFKLSKWEKQQYIELIPNDKYFDKKPYLDKVIFKIIPDATNLLVQLKTGEIDMMDGVPPIEANRLKNTNPEINIYPISGRVYFYIGYNEKNELFKDVKVRRALTMAIDRQTIIKALLFGFGKTCLGHIPPMTSWAYNSNIEEIPFSPQLSSKILEERGWLDHDNNGILDNKSREFEFTIAIAAGSQLKADLALVIQEQLKKAGIKVSIETIENAALHEKLNKKEFDVYIGAWSVAMNVDLTPVFHSTSTNLYNYVSYNNPEVDKLIDQARREFDQAKAAEYWKQVQQLIYDDQPYTFLFWMDRIVAVNSKFKDVKPMPISAFNDLENWYRTE